MFGKAWRYSSQVPEWVSSPLNWLAGVGAPGRVIAVDIQPRMIAGLKHRLAKAGLLERVEVLLAQPDSMGIGGGFAGRVDFTLAFAVVHEMPSAGRFFAEVSAASKPRATLLFAEPRGHVTDAQLADELQAAKQAGFAVVDRPSIPRSHAAILKKASE
jgi:SAM-dependent methyltransferase